jgi:hypothetical protein
MTSAISTTRSQATEPATAFATLRVSGDELAPGEITKILKILPTKAYAKGEHYSGGPRSPDLIGRTGMWLFSTNGVVACDTVTDHLTFVARLLLPDSGEVGPLPRLQQIVRRKSLEVSLSCFWHGPAGAKKPSVPRSITELLKLIPAEIGTDFGTDEQSGRHAA